MVLLQSDPFLNELTSMFERSTEKGSIWVSIKRSSMKCKATRNKMETAGQPIEYRCLVRATDGKKTISTSLSAKEYQKFQASYATVLKAHMHALKKRERKDKKKTIEPEKIQESTKSNSSKKGASSTSKPSKMKHNVSCFGSLICSGSSRMICMLHYQPKPLSIRCMTMRLFFFVDTGINLRPSEGNSSLVFLLNVESNFVIAHQSVVSFCFLPIV